MVLTAEQIIVLVKRRLNIAANDTTANELLTDIEAEMRQKILDYCRIRGTETDPFPDGLQFTLVNMIVDSFNETKEKQLKELSVVTNVSDSGQSVGYKSTVDAFKTSENDRDLIRGYSTILNNYRRVRYRE